MTGSLAFFGDLARPVDVEVEAVLADGLLLADPGRLELHACRGLLIGRPGFPATTPARPGGEAQVAYGGRRVRQAEELVELVRRDATDESVPALHDGVTAASVALAVRLGDGTGARAEQQHRGDHGGSPGGQATLGETSHELVLFGRSKGVYALLLARSARCRDPRRGAEAPPRGPRRRGQTAGLTASHTEQLCESPILVSATRWALGAANCRRSPCGAYRGQVGANCTFGLPSRAKLPQ